MRSDWLSVTSRQAAAHPVYFGHFVPPSASLVSAHQLRGRALLRGAAQSAGGGGGTPVVNSNGRSGEERKEEGNWSLSATARRRAPNNNKVVATAAHRCVRKYLLASSSSSLSTKELGLQLAAHDRGAVVAHGRVPRRALRLGVAVDARDYGERGGGGGGEGGRGGGGGGGRQQVRSDCESSSPQEHSSVLTTL